MAYLGADGFYWVSEYHPDNPNIIEVRKGKQEHGRGLLIQENIIMRLTDNLVECGEREDEFQLKFVV